MALWSTTLRLGEDLKLLVTSPEGDDLIKARLPIRPPHPRALLSLLEGIALFSGEPLYAVISAGEDRDAWLGSEPTFCSMPSASAVRYVALIDPLEAEALAAYRLRA